MRPFAITVVDATGRSLVEGFTSPGLVEVNGTAARPDPTTLVVTPADGSPAVTIRFDPAASPVSLPDSIASGAVRVQIRHDPASRGPGGVPLLVRGFRVADVNGRYRFFAGEGDLRDGEGIAVVPRPLGPEAAGEDQPILAVVAPGTQLEPSECGDVYYDRLRITGSQGDVIVDRRDDAVVPVAGGGDLPAWTVRNVDVWHRGGSDPGGSECAGVLRSWFQAAGWR